jgi:hypothetical protein
MAAESPATGEPDPAREAEIVLAAYHEQCEQSRHYENQHLTVIGFVMGVAATIVTLATFDERLSWRDVWLGGAIAAIGAFGFLASIAYYARTTRHARRAEELRFRLDRLLPAPALTAMRATADARAAERLRSFAGLQRVRLHQVWLALDVVVLAVGVIVIALALGSGEAP